MRYIFIILFCSYGFATKAEPLDNEALQVKLGQWHLGLGVGLGVAKNPLNGGDDFPLLLLPDVAYYDEHFYFDNGQFGYTVFDKKKHVVSFISELNPEKRFFIFWHPSNVFLNSSTMSNAYSTPVIGQDDPVIDQDEQLKNINTDDISKRKWAFDSGINYQYFNKDLIVRANLLADISDVYNGWRVGLELEYQLFVGNLIVQPMLGVWYKSSELNSYYYGLSEKDNLDIFYPMDGGFQPYAHLQLTWPMSENKAVLFKLKYDDYSNTSDSPLFKYDYAVNIFMGLKYIF